MGHRGMNFSGRKGDMWAGTGTGANSAGARGHAGRNSDTACGGRISAGGNCTLPPSPSTPRLHDHLVTPKICSESLCHHEVDYIAVSSTGSQLRYVRTGTEIMEVCVKRLWWNKPGFC